MLDITDNKEKANSKYHEISFTYTIGKIPKSKKSLFCGGWG